MPSRAISAPLGLSLNRTVLRSIGLRSQSKAAQRHAAICKWCLYGQILSGRPFTTNLGIAVQGLHASEGTPETPAAQVPVPRVVRRIRTLDPARLTVDDYLDFSSKLRPIFRVVLRSNDGPGLEPIPIHVSRTEWSSGVFPPGTAGFLYYHAPLNSTPLAGELRFRLTGPSRDPTSFAGGSDLLTEHGTRWRYPLWKVVWRPSYRELTSLLIQDGLISQQTLDAVTKAAMSLPTVGSLRGPSEDVSKRSRSPVLSRLWQEFEFRFKMVSNRRYLLAGPDGIVTQSFRFIPTWPVLADNGVIHYCPFEGSAICRFERSELPEHIGMRVAVLRVVRLLANDPIRHVPAPDGKAYPIEELRPREGELVKKMYRGQAQPWAVDVDKGWERKGTLRQSLRILFENEELYGSPQKL